MPNLYVNKVVQSNGTTLIDISDTTATAADVSPGKYFYLASGEKAAGASSGGSPSQSQHTILFEFEDTTSASITAYWDGTFISDAIRATTPTTYNNKTVTLAQLDGTTWYEPADIPLNTQLVDYNAVRTGYGVEADGSIITSEAWNCVTDYMAIGSAMVFSFACNQYSNIGFYDKNMSPIKVVVANDIKDSAADYVAYGTLSSPTIPINAAYVVLQGNSYGIESLSLIRTS